MQVPRWALGVGVAATVATTAIVPAVGAGADTGEVDLHAALHHSAVYTHATGYSEYERSTAKRDVKITVTAPGLAGKWVTVYVNYKRAGTMRLSSTGYGHREWSTEHGQYVPLAYAGDPVRVRKYTNSVLVASGWYQREYTD